MVTLGAACQGSGLWAAESLEDQMIALSLYDSAIIALNLENGEYTFQHKPLYRCFLCHNGKQSHGAMAQAVQLLHKFLDVFLNTAWRIEGPSFASAVNAFDQPGQHIAWP